VFRDRLCPLAEVQLRGEQTYYQPPPTRKSIEATGVHYDSPVQQELERCLLFGLQPGNPQHGVPTRFHLQPGYQRLAPQDGRCSASAEAKQAIHEAFIWGKAATLLSPLSTKAGTGWVPMAKLSAACPGRA
jgi:hypothetical protein